MVTVENLTKVFRRERRDEVIAVSDVTFSIDDGEAFALLGPNAAGKTTTLRMLATILKPTSGTAVIDGYTLAGAPDQVRRRVGFLTGDTRLYDRLTPRESFFYFGRLNNLADEWIEKRIRDLTSMLDLRGMLDRRIGTLSEGTQQKVSIGRAIVHDPRFLILDEPLTSLDILARRAVTGFIRLAREEKRSILFSTHVMGEAEELCDGLAIISRGRILESGEKRELKERYHRGLLEEIFVDLIQSHEQDHPDL